jgi:hypothetical protein
MPTPVNTALYDKIKDEVYKENPKHSLFRSAQVVKRYKEAGGTYTDGKSKTGIKNWFNAKWVSVNDYYHTGKVVPCGSSDTQKKYNEYPLCRPLNIVKQLERDQMKVLITAKDKIKSKPVRSEKILKTDKYNVSKKYT